jgi:hypothetical protein
MSDRLLLASDYVSLRVALNERRMALKMTMLELDARAGLTEGHGSKLLCGTRNFGEVTLPLLLGALGVAICLVEIPADGRTYKIKAIRRDAFLKRRLSQIAAKGGKARFAKMSAEQKADFCRKGRQARAEKIARHKAMTELGRMGGNKTQELRRAAAELSTDI